MSFICLCVCYLSLCLLSVFVPVICLCVYYLSLCLLSVFVSVICLCVCYLSLCLLSVFMSVSVFVSVIELAVWIMVCNTSITKVSLRGVPNHLIQGRGGVEFCPRSKLFPSSFYIIYNILSLCSFLPLGILSEKRGFKGSTTRPPPPGHLCSFHHQLVDHRTIILISQFQG